MDSLHEIDGGALEGLVAQHLRAWIAYSNNDSTLYYWRTKSGVEVDFVLYGKDTFLAIEVKSSSRINSKMLKGLKTFKDDYPEAQAMVLYRGEERLVINDILCLPCDQFLQQLLPGEAIIANPLCIEPQLENTKLTSNPGK